MVVTRKLLCRLWFDLIDKTWSYQVYGPRCDNFTISWWQQRVEIRIKDVNSVEVIPLEIGMLQNCRNAESVVCDGTMLGAGYSWAGSPRVMQQCVPPRPSCRYKGAAILTSILWPQWQCSVIRNRISQQVCCARRYVLSMSIWSVCMCCSKCGTDKQTKRTCSVHRYISLRNKLAGWSWSQLKHN